MKADLEVSLPVERRLETSSPLPRTPTMQYSGVRNVSDGKRITIRWPDTGAKDLVLEPGTGWVPIYGRTLFSSSISADPAGFENNAAAMEALIQVVKQHAPDHPVLERVYLTAPQ